MWLKATRDRSGYVRTMPLTFKEVRVLWAYDLALREENLQFGNVRSCSNAPQHIVVVPREGGKTGAKTDEVLIDSLWPCRSKGGCAGMLGPLDVICLEEVELDGGD